MKISMRTMIPATMMALSALTVTNCGNKSENTVQKITNRTELPAPYDSTKTNRTELPAPYDSTKTNLPIIDGNRVTYRNTDGDVVTLNAIYDAENTTLSLYKAISTFSTKENPNITEPEKFYTEVQKNIPKINNDIWRDTHELLKSIGITNSISLLNKLYDIFTAPDSEQGKTITVDEYTQMMDAWSSTGEVEYN